MGKKDDKQKKAQQAGQKSEFMQRAQEARDALKTRQRAEEAIDTTAEEVDEKTGGRQPKKVSDYAERARAEQHEE
ncbi:hypothetical protein [Streptomyces abikoensis]